MLLLFQELDIKQQNKITIMNTYINPNAIKDNSVDGKKLKDNSVGGGKLKPNILTIVCDELAFDDEGYILNGNVDNLDIYDSEIYDKLIHGKINYIKLINYHPRTTEYLSICYISIYEGRISSISTTPNIEYGDNSISVSIFLSYDGNRDLWQLKVYEM